MGATQPYIYAPPSGYTANDPYGGFDPKAHTRASRVPPQQRKPKQEGPLLDFNRHPDSYLILPYGQTDATPLPPTTKRNVKFTRWVQFALRILGMIAAVGVLICAICITNIQGNEGWIVRAAPAIDILVTTYAIYHLSRSAKGRTPASSASYHLFAIIMDLCLIPFYVYIALADHSNLEEPANKEDRWKSFFKNKESTQQLLQYTWEVAVGAGSLHLATIGLSFYLVVMFRKISNLPPDMNPLEDNLTSRRKSKHKHKSSELASNKHDSAIAMSEGRNSPTKDSEISERPLSFFQTRAGGSPVYSPHNPTTANLSRNNLPVVAPSIYTQSDSARASRVDLNARPSSIVRAGSPARSVKTAKTDPLSHSPSLTASSGYSEHFTSSYPPLPRKSSKRHSGTFTSTENWYAIGDDSDDDAENRPPEIPAVEEEPEESSIMETGPYISSPSRNMLSPNSRPYELVRQSSQHLDPESDVDMSSYDRRYAPTPPPQDAKKHSPLLDKAELQPLAMNPPTPPPPAVNLIDASPNSRSGTPHGGALQDVSGNEMISDNGTPTKGRYYGDLHSAMQSIRKISRNGNTNEPGYGMSDWLRGTSKRVTQKKSNVVSPYVKNDMSPKQGQAGMDGKGRVISRSGADLGDPSSYMEDVPGQFQDRRVSGKIAEEGRGGGWARRRISGRDV